MAEENTAEQALAHNVQVMGKPLGELYSALWQETALLSIRWSEFLALFATKPKRIELMNSAAPGFFRAVQDTMLESLVLHIARMVDPPRTAGKENLSLTAVKDLEADQGIHKLVDEAVRSAEAARDWRHRVLAHKDRDLALDSGSRELSSIDRKMIQIMIDSVVAVLNALSARHLGSETAFHLGAGPGGAISLLDVLDEGVRARAERQARIMSGEPTEDDLASRDL